MPYDRSMTIVYVTCNMFRNELLQTDTKGLRPTVHDGSIRPPSDTDPRLPFPLGFICCRLCVPQGVNHPTGSPDKEQMRISSPAEWRENPLRSEVKEHKWIPLPASGLSPILPLILSIRLGTRPLHVFRSRPLGFLSVVFFGPLVLPSTDALLGRMVMAPSATRSWPITGEILDPQLSEPTHRKWPVWLLLFAASRTRLVKMGEKKRKKKKEMR